MAAKKPLFEDLVDMTAMVDIVFFLLIFFMVTSMQGTFSSLKMPASDGKYSDSHGPKRIQPNEPDQDTVMVRIDHDNAVWLNDTEIPGGSGCENELTMRLREARKGSASKNKLLVLGNSECVHATVVMVLDAGTESGFEEMQLAVDDES
jgi:biopolymer transport protein ExbD